MHATQSIHSLRAAPTASVTELRDVLADRPPEQVLSAIVEDGRTSGEAVIRRVWDQNLNTVHEKKKSGPEWAVYVVRRIGLRHRP